jgi:hypothetical protein
LVVDPVDGADELPRLRVENPELARGRDVDVEVTQVPRWRDVLGIGPYVQVRMTRNVLGLISSTVPGSPFGTYTRSGNPATALLNFPRSMPA